MKNNLKKLLVFSFILGLIPLFTACGNKAEEGNAVLKERFNTVNSEFLNTIKKANLKFYGVLSCDTTPSIPDVIARAFNADKSLMAEKRPSYKNFNFTKYDDGQLDDAFVPVREDFYIIINNDGHDPKNIQLYIDTNGAKGPNVYGYDLFGYNVEPGDKLVPLLAELDPTKNPNYFDELE